VLSSIAPAKPLVNAFSTRKGSDFSNESLTFQADTQNVLCSVHVAIMRLERHTDTSHPANPMHMPFAKSWCVSILPQHLHLRREPRPLRGCGIGRTSK